MSSADLFQHGQPVYLRHIDICNNHIRTPVGQLFHRVHCIHGCHYLKRNLLLFPQHDFEPLQHDIFIIYQQYFQPHIFLPQKSMKCL